MADTIYNVAKDSFLSGDLDWDADDIRALLLTGSVSIDKDHATVAAVVAANTEASDGSYARVALSSKTTTQNDTDDRAEADAATIDWTSLTGETPTAMVIFLQVTNDSDSVPISLHDSNFGVTANGAGYTTSFPTDVLRLS